MTEIRNVTLLSPGERFIWADDETREFIRTDEDDNHVNFQVLTFDRIKSLELNNSHIIYFYRLNGIPDKLYVKGHHKVVVIQDAYACFRNRVRCNNCQWTYGDHFAGKDARVNGIHCKENGSGLWFVPNEQDLAYFHGLVLKEEFFESLGL